MITVQSSPTADTRTCDFKNVSLDTLLNSSKQHIHDVQEGLRYFESLIRKAAENHDFDKLSDIEGFHRDFLTGFERTEWWDKHRQLNRHHINYEDGIRPDVNLIDVLDYIVDCVMAGMARSGTVYQLELDPDLLKRAFDNTVELLKKNVSLR
jgi:hypothetical protein